MAAVGDEKIGDVDVRQAGLSSSSSDRPAPTGVNSDAASGGSKVDAAWKFLNEHRDVDVDGVAAIDINGLRHKIDWHIVPLMFCCYTMQFLDKVILNVRQSSIPPLRSPRFVSLVRATRCWNSGVSIELSR